MPDQGITLLGRLAVVAIVVILLMCLGAGGLLEIPLRLMFGWCMYLFNVLPRVTIHWPAVGMGVRTLAAFGVGLHVALTRVIVRFRSENSPPTWKWQWTAAIVTIVVLMFVSGIGLVGVTHQVGWLMSSDQKWFKGFGPARRTQSKNNLKQIGLAMHNHHVTEGHFPPGATFDETGRALHSWQTALLPYIDQQPLFKTIDLQRPWDDPANKEPFGTVVSVYQNPGNPESDVPRMTSYGPASEPPEYARSHYSANVHLFGARGGPVIRDITDGTSNTILSGEIIDNFPAWGEPLNWRDPALGIGKSANGFGGPWANDGGNIANFLFADGAVQILSGDIDPDVLKALATPSGGERVAQDDW